MATALPLEGSNIPLKRTPLISMEAVADVSPLVTTAPTYLVPVARSESTRLAGGAVLQPTSAAASAHNSGTVCVMSAQLAVTITNGYGIGYTI